MRNKEELIQQFQAYLETTPHESPPEEGMVDLFQFYTELVALKNEVRLESRQVKEALDRFRSLVDPLQASHDILREENRRLRDDKRETSRETLRPLLLELLELRDRLAAGVVAPSGKRISKLFRRICRKEQELMEGWQEGQAMTLRRLDQLLAARGVQAMTLLHQPLDPHLARAVSVVTHKGVADGVVVEELRQGFLWQGDVLRPAEVAVNRQERK